MREEPVQSAGFRPEAAVALRKDRRTFTASATVHDREEDTRSFSCQPQPLHDTRVSMSVLTDLGNRGVRGVFFVGCTGLTCVVHLMQALLPDPCIPAE